MGKVTYICNCCDVKKHNSLIEKEYCELFHCDLEKMDCDYFLKFISKHYELLKEKNLENYIDDSKSVLIWNPEQQNFDIIRHHE